MKKLAKYTALAAIAAILGGCSFAVGALNHHKSRVVASAVWHGRSAAPAARTARSRGAAMSLFPLVGKSRALPPRPASAVVRSSRSFAPVVSRDISASTDIDYITYEIVNLDPNSGEAAIQDYVDPYYPYIDVFLTPGQTYRITVDVALLPTSPALTAGVLVGIDAYGDSADIAVPADGSDVWVDLTIHPTGILIKNQATGTAVTYVKSGGSITTSPGTTTGSTSPQDKFFYTSDSRLYYFNYSNNSVYEWPDINNPLNTAAFGGLVAAGGPGIQIYAICPDPAYAGWFYVVGKNTTSGFWELYVVNFDPIVGPPATWYYTNDITAAVEDGRTTPVVSVTGVTADPYGYAYVTFYNTPTVGGGTPVSGIVEYYSYGYPTDPSVAQYVPDTTAAWTSADSIFTDVTYTGSNLYVLASPNTTAGQVGDHNIGTADVFVLDPYLVQLSINPSPIANAYVSLTDGASLVRPNKFIGTIQGGKFFVSQFDFAGAGNEYLSSVSLDLSSATSVP